MKRLYTVRRWVRETYEVELDTVLPPTREQIKDAAIDPHTIEVMRETVRPVKGTEIRTVRKDATEKETQTGQPTFNDVGGNPLTNDAASVGRRLKLRPEDDDSE